MLVNEQERKFVGKEMPRKEWLGKSCRNGKIEEHPVESHGRRQYQRNSRRMKFIENDCAEKKSCIKHYRKTGQQK
jgi:hypothetical protein